MKNQYLIIFITNIFLIACTTTPQANNYSYTETGRWIASAKEKASAKKSAIMFLTDQAVSSCTAVDRILRQIEQQKNAGQEVQVSEDDIKNAMLEADAQGRISLRNPDCKDKIFALAQVVCDGKNNDEPLCAAVRLRQQVDRAISEFYAVDAHTQEIEQELGTEDRGARMASAKRNALRNTIRQLESEIREQEQKLTDDESSRIIGRTSAVAIGALSMGSVFLRALHPTLLPSIVATGGFLGSGVSLVLGVILLIEAGILIYSLVKAFDRCENTNNIERCKRRYFARTHNNIWVGIFEVPIQIMTGLISVFTRD